jgi:hypothetical protein
VLLQLLLITKNPRDGHLGLATTLVAQGDDWPTDYYHGFDQPMAVITAILLDAENWGLSICWPEIFSGWTDAESLLTCLESIDCASSAYRIFGKIDGCSLKDSLWDA